MTLRKGRTSAPVLSVCSRLPHNTPSRAAACFAPRPPPPSATSYLQQGTGYPLYESPSRRLLQGAIAVGTDSFYRHCTSTRAFGCLRCSRPTFRFVPRYLTIVTTKFRRVVPKPVNLSTLLLAGALARSPRKLVPRCRSARIRSSDVDGGGSLLLRFWLFVLEHNKLWSFED
jgi:hypothetical protein